MPHTHRAVIEGHAPPAMTVIAVGDREFCEAALAQWVEAHPLGDDEEQVLLEVVGS